MNYKSKWDHPGMAELVEGIWQSTDEVELRRQVAEWMGPQKGKFLDLGCGTATMAAYFPMGYYGVDGSQEMLRLARLRAKKRPLVLCDFGVETLPFADGFFDFALCMQVLRHMNSYDHVLRELARVVKGSVFIHDIFYEGTQHIFSTGDLGGETFLNNTWALSVFLADLTRYFPWREVRTHAFPWGSMGVEIIG
jgi:SAM-dependent methyltransferase